MMGEMTQLKRHARLQVNDDTGLVGSELPTLLANLIEDKLNSNPSHRMVMSWTPAKSGPRLYQVKVYFGNEELGTIGVQRGSSPYGKITLTNPTIASVTLRKGHMATSKANALSAKYDKYFRPATRSVLANRLRRAARAAMYQQRLYRRGQYSPVTAFVSSLTRHVMDNYDEYRDIAARKGFKFNDKYDLPSLHSAYSLVDDITPRNQLDYDPLSEGRAKENEAGQGFYLYIDDIYLVLDHTGKKIGAHLPSELPEDMALQIGMLKVANDKTFIKDVGYRYQKDFFYVKGDYNDYT